MDSNDELVESQSKKVAAPKKARTAAAILKAEPKKTSGRKLPFASQK